VSGYPHTGAFASAGHIVTQDISRLMTKSLHNHSVHNRKWIKLSNILRPRQDSIGYIGDGFYRSKDPTNSFKVSGTEGERQEMASCHLIPNSFRKHH